MPASASPPSDVHSALRRQERQDQRFRLSARSRGLTQPTGPRTREQLTELELQRLNRWRVSTFWVMFIGYIGYYFCRKNISAALPLMGEALNYSNAQLGIILAASEISYAVGKLINGPLGDRVGGRRIFLVGLFGAIVFNVAFAFSTTLPLLIAAWCACRYFLSMGWGGLAKTIGNWYPPEKNGTVMGLISMNFQVGDFLATSFAALLVAVGVAWNGLFLWPAAVALVVLVYSWLASRESPQAVVPGVIYGGNEGGGATGGPLLAGAEEGNVKQIIASLLKLSVFRQLLLYSFLTTMLRTVFLLWTPKFLVDCGMGTASAILGSAIFPILGAAGTFGLGWYTDRYARDGDRARAMSTMLGGLTVCLVGITFLSLSAHPNHVLLVLLLGASGFCLLGPYSMSSGCLTLDIAGAKGAGSCTGLIDGVGYFGAAISAIGAGIASEYFGWAGVFSVLTGLSFLSVASAFLMSRYFRARAAEARLAA